jgi:hypothetical protein
MPEPLSVLYESLTFPRFSGLDNDEEDPMIKKVFATTAASVLLVGAVATTAGAASDDTDTKPAPAGEPATNGRHPILRGAIRLSVKTAADTIGVEPSELRDAVRSGQTIGEFAQSKGVEPDRVEAAIVDALTARIDQAVAAGKVPEERATKAKEKVSTFADRVVNGLPKRARTSAAG